MVNRKNQTAAVVMGAVAGAVGGFVLGRSQGCHARRVLGSNYKWMTAEERQVARSLITHGQGHIFKAWPQPGINDAAKRRLLAAAARHLSGAAEGLEEERLSVLVPPRANQQPKELHMHNDLRIDKFYWLRDDARKAPAVLEYLKAENQYTAAAMADTVKLQDELYKEMRGRIKEEDTSVAARYQGYYYYTRAEEGQQYAVHCRRAVPARAGPPSEADEPSPDAPEEVLLDENKRKQQGKHKFYMVGCCETSPDQKLLAWTEDTKGGEKYTLHIRDLSNGKELIDPIPMTSGDVVWANDNATLFYIVKDHLDRPYKVLRHTIGSPTSYDAVVYEEKDEAFYVSIGRSHSEQLILIQIGSAVTSETCYISANDPTARPNVILPRINDVEYSVSHHPGKLSSGGIDSSSKDATGWFIITHRDPRVGYWEPAKFVARLRELKTNNKLLLLKTELSAGHFSVTGRFERLKETAFEYAFLLKTAGMLNTKPKPGSASSAAVPGPNTQTTKL
eukprot:GHRR01036705.1.p1 GENE.GHRR01036705.1~~GHRR01036705.1.p1  ORF type:complete len:506 (+),score=173.15 GHRR01036705.1:386-1903(+)